MTDMQYLTTPKDCIALRTTLNLDKPVIAIYATGLPRQTVDVMLYLRDGLLELNYQVIFLLRESGIKYFEKIIGARSMEMIYCCDDASLVEYCTYIDILFAIDTIISASIAQKFKGKIVFSPHNFPTRAPACGAAGFWVDYYLLPNRSYVASKFNYKLYPNYIKRSRPSNFSIIAGGYLKIDLGYERFLQENLVPRKCKRVVYFTHSDLWMSAYLSRETYDRFIKEEVNFLSSFFESYPNYELVLRPEQEDVKLTRYVKIKEKFKNNPQFIFDDQKDNLKYLVTADIFLTCFSGAKENYAYITLQPYINLTFERCKDIVKTNLGYNIGSFTDVYKAIDLVCESKESWKSEIKTLRSEILPLFGKFRDYLCANMENMLNDTPQPEWIVVNKHTTSGSLKNELMNFSRNLELATTDQHSFFLRDVFYYLQNKFPKNIPIGFSVLKFGLQIFAKLDPEFWIADIKPYLELVNYLPQDKLLKFLRYSIKKYPNNPAVQYFLAKELLQYPLESEEFKQGVNYLVQLNQSNEKLCLCCLFSFPNLPQHFLVCYQAILGETKLHEHLMAMQLLNSQVPDLTSLIHRYVSLLYNLALYAKLQQELSYTPRHKLYMLHPITHCFFKYVGSGFCPFKQEMGNPAHSLAIEVGELHFEGLKHMQHFLEFLDEHKDEVKLNETNIWDAYIIRHAPRIFKSVAKVFGQKNTAIGLLYLRKWKYAICNK